MARPKTDKSNTTSVVEQTEKTTEVEQTEKPADVEETPAVKPKPEDGQEEKPADEKSGNDNKKVVIVCAAYAGKSIVLPTRTIQLDENGCCEVTEKEAERLLTIPGYKLAE